MAMLDYGPDAVIMKGLDGIKAPEIKTAAETGRSRSTALPIELPPPAREASRT